VWTIDGRSADDGRPPFDVEGDGVVTAMAVTSDGEGGRWPAVTGQEMWRESTHITPSYMWTLDSEIGMELGYHLLHLEISIWRIATSEE
jgi:hypothetical protein